MNNISAVRKIITSAELLAIHTAPIEIVPAPGAGQALIFLGAFYSMVYNSATYAVGTGAGVYYGTGHKADNVTAGTSLLLNASDSAQISGPNPVSGALNTVENEPLNFYATADFTTGDSDMTITVFYSRVLL